MKLIEKAHALIEDTKLAEKAQTLIGESTCD